MLVGQVAPVDQVAVQAALADRLAAVADRAPVVGRGHRVAPQGVVGRRVASLVVQVPAAHRVADPALVGPAAGVGRVRRVALPVVVGRRVACPVAQALAAHRVADRLLSVLAVVDQVRRALDQVVLLPTGPWVLLTVARLTRQPGQPPILRRFEVPGPRAQHCYRVQRGLY